VTRTLSGGDLAARQSLCLENPFEAECWLLIFPFFFNRVARLIWLMGLFARGLGVRHSCFSQLRNAGLSPNLDKS
jgi:hypothetical protein